MKSKTGFTLIELMIVIALLAILATVGAVYYSGSQKNARDAKRRSDIVAIYKAIIAYSIQNNYYPPSKNLNQAEWSCGHTISSWSDCDDFQQELRPFIESLPYDPLDKALSTENINCTNSPCYFYRTSNPEHTTFYIATTLENPPLQPIPACSNGFPTDSRWNYCLTASLK